MAYLVRLWREGGSGAAVWRATVEDPHTGELMGFPDVDALLVFLKTQTTVEQGCKRLRNGD